jgi:hypothetical protein
MGSVRRSSLARTCLLPPVTDAEGPINLANLAGSNGGGRKPNQEQFVAGVKAWELAPGLV